MQKLLILAMGLCLLAAPLASAIDAAVEGEDTVRGCTSGGVACREALQVG